MFQSSGILRYGPGFRAILLVDQGISDFYRSMIPKWEHVDRQLYPAHISVVRHETPPLLGSWESYDGEEVRFDYDTTIHADGKYFWINAWSPRLCEIRTELGLPPYRSWRGSFHITVGNMKGCMI